MWKARTGPWEVGRLVREVMGMPPIQKIILEKELYCHSGLHPWSMVEAVSMQVVL